MPESEITNKETIVGKSAPQSPFVWQENPDFEDLLANFHDALIPLLTDCTSPMMLVVGNSNPWLTSALNAVGFFVVRNVFPARIRGTFSNAEISGKLAPKVRQID
eukprot:282325_1